MKYRNTWVACFYWHCMKNHSCISEPDVKSSNAKVYYTGPGPDGCGWVIQVNSTSYRPTTELATEFQVNELPVTISYKLSNSNFACFKAHRYTTGSNSVY
jgi:hypothetical protein